MTVEIVTIGDELLIGQIVNTNQSYIAERLTGAGITVVRMSTVGDDQAAILQAWREALDGADAVIVTGGLGPTHDDITKKAACAFFDSDLVASEPIRAHIQELLRRRGGTWNPAADEQTLVPRKAEIVPNPVGTAAGMKFERDGKFLFILPGVPYEMKEMIDQSVVPFLRDKAKGSIVRLLTLRTTGAAESVLSSMLGDIPSLLGDVRLAFLPSPRGVRLRLTAHASSADIADGRIRLVEQRMRERIGNYIYGTGDEELEEVVGRLLTAKKMTIAVAESCTGGLIANRITNVSGSSSYFDRGMVTYSNKSKIELLGVPETLMEKHGAVSAEVAEAMASGIRTRSGAAIGLSTTGIAGPTGGSPTKPVGLVWIGYADQESAFAVKFQFADARARVKERASQAALDLVRRKILKI